MKIELVQANICAIQCKLVPVMEDQNYLKRPFDLDIFNRLKNNEMILNSERIFLYTYMDYSTTC